MTAQTWWSMLIKNNYKKAMEIYNYLSQNHKWNLMDPVSVDLAKLSQIEKLLLGVPESFDEL